MSRLHYSAFLIRHWTRPNGAVRIEVSHVQSGASATVTTLQAAVEWISAQGPGWAAGPLPPGEVAPAPNRPADANRPGERPGANPD